MVTGENTQIVPLEVCTGHKSRECSEVPCHFFKELSVLLSDLFAARSCGLL